MPAAPPPANEAKRLQALGELDILDTAPERAFDALVEAAAQVCGVPISLTSLVDAERQWFKANVGLPGVNQTPRAQAFCAHAILQDGLFEVPDATEDARFSDNTLVTGDPGIRFYAGAVLQLADGARAGTLCVIDRQPRRLDDTQRQVLRSLAAAAVQMLEARRALREERRLRLAVADSEARFRALSAASPLGVYATDASGACTYTNERWQQIYGLSLAQSLGQGWASTLHPDDRAAVYAEWLRTADTGDGFDMEFRIAHPDGGLRTVRSRARAERDELGVLAGYVGSVEDVSDARATREQLQAEQRRLASIIAGTDVGTWEWNVATGETRFNERWAGIMGHTLASLAPVSLQTWFDHGHPDDLARSGDLLARHFAGESPSYECEVRMRHRDGHWVWVLARGRVMSRAPDGGPGWMYGTHLDISERKRAEAALRHSEALLNRTGEVAGVGGWELDLRTGVLQWSAQTRVIHGVSPDYVPTLDGAIEFYAPEARASIHAAVERGMATGEPWDMELPLIRADGGRIWVRAVGQVTFEDGRPVRLLGAFQDITARRALHAELADQHELLRVTLRSIGDAVITTDAAQCVTWLNPVAERLTGWAATEARGRPVGEVMRLVDEGTRAPLAQAPSAGLPAGARAERTLLLSRDGVEYGIEDSASPIRNEAGEVLGAVRVFRDVTEQRRLSSEMTYRATHDALTGLVNRSEFENRLRRVLQHAHEDGHTHALLYLDLDQFKRVNDECGHAVGDLLLQQVAKLLRECVRARDTLARLGGDEFGVILEHCSAEQAQRVGQQICQRMDDFRFVHDDRRFRVGASIGLVPVDSRWAGTAALLQAADTSCYAAKEAGRNRVHPWLDTDEAMQARQGELQWASRIEQALDDDRFMLYAQRLAPLTDQAAGLHAEVLLRLRDVDGAVVPAGAFLPAAERFHLASRIDRWVLGSVVSVLRARHNLSGLGGLSVNLSGQSIGDRAFHRHALDLLMTAGPAVCRCLCLEITETVAVTHVADAGAFVDQVRALGVRVALDDFGAGASSFGYLKGLRVDQIKIDGQFIRDLLDDPLDEAAVRCFVDVARVVGVHTVAEFVDRPEILARVRELGIDFAQGYLLHRPEPLERLTDEMAGVGALAA